MHKERWIGLKGGQLCLLLLCVLLGACSTRQKNEAPEIKFSKIPPAAQGGREKLDVISGSVSGVRSGQQIVIYARSGPWWVQPWPENPLVPIQADSTWSTSTHLGFEYAALLVNPGYHPPPTMDVAPSQGGPIALVSIVKGTGSGIALAPTKPLHFSGYDWKVRTIASDRGGHDISGTSRPAALRDRRRAVPAQSRACCRHRW